MVGIPALGFAGQISIGYGKAGTGSGNGKGRMAVSVFVCKIRTTLAGGRSTLAEFVFSDFGNPRVSSVSEEKEEAGEG